MRKEIFSNHIGGSSELTLLADIKPGYVPCRGLITYSARLRRHLRLLGALRRVGLEARRAGVYSGPIDALRTLQYVRWTLVDDDTRMLLAVNFDRPFEPYVRRIVDIAGPLLDTILCHCEGFLGHESDRGFDRFMTFASRFQVPVELFAAAAPNMTVDDGDYFRQTDSLLRDRPPEGSIGTIEDRAEQLRVETIHEKLARKAETDPLPLLDQALNILQALFDNAHLFPPKDFRGDDSRDDLLYYRLAERLTPGFWSGIHSRLPIEKRPDIGNPFSLGADDLKRINDVVDALIAGSPQLESPLLVLLKRYSDARKWFATPPDPRPLPDTDPSAVGDIQPGLLTKIRPVPNAACQMLLRIDSAAGGRAFLAAMAERIWPASDVAINLSITHAGLKAIGIGEDLRRQFPAAFREGMSARAGYLGDTDANNPSQWQWPRANWKLTGGALAPANGPELTEDTIDIIVHVAKAVDVVEPDALATFGPDHPLFDEVTEIAVLAGSYNVTLTVIDALFRNLEPLGTGRIAMRGHSGFMDGISQPHYGANGEYSVPNAEQGNALEAERSPLGDLLLGHQSKAELVFARRPSDGQLEVKPFVRYTGSALRDGTFQVIRKISFDKAEFDRVGNHLHPDDPKPNTAAIQAAMMGRTRDGAPLAGGGTGEQDFHYRIPPSDGTRNDHETATPPQSHIRRTNPREAETPRILRRGYSYGPTGGGDNVDRGTMFIAYNANIAEQFEVIQRWISGGNSTGLSSDQGDPLLAPRRVDRSRTFRFRHDEKVVRVNLPDQPIAKLRWGIYAFTPSREGLVSLSEGDATHSDLAVHDTPSPVPRKVNLDENTSFETWKLLLEDIDDERRGDREAVWRDIRDRGGAVRTAYGVLVGGPQQVRQVLENEADAFSVRHYWDCMRRSIGVQYLGYDDPPQETEATDPAETQLDKVFLEYVKPKDHKTERAEIDGFLRPLTPEVLFEASYRVAQGVIVEIPDDVALLPSGQKDAPIPDRTGKRILAEPFFYEVIARLCREWFGLPDDGITFGGPQTDEPHCPIDLVNGSFHVFWPHPTAHHIATSEVRTKALVDAVKDHVRGTPAPAPDTLLHYLLNRYPDADDERKGRIAEVVAGASFGFAGPTSGSLRAVFFDWIESGFLWRAKHRMAEAQAFDPQQTQQILFQLSEQILRPEIVTSMAKRAAPDLLHRVAVKSATLGPVSVQPGERIVMSLGSATAGAPDDRLWYLFGGGDSSKAIHACQGREMGLQVIAGVMAAMMEGGEIRPESPQSVRIRPPTGQ